MPRTLRPEQIMPQVSSEDIMRMYNQMNQGQSPPPSEDEAVVDAQTMRNANPLKRPGRTRMPFYPQETKWEGQKNGRPSPNDLAILDEAASDGDYIAFEEHFGPGSAQHWQEGGSDKAARGSPLHNRTRAPNADKY